MQRKKFEVDDHVQVLDTSPVFQGKRGVIIAFDEGRVIVLLDDVPFAPAPFAVEELERIEARNRVE